MKSKRLFRGWWPWHSRNRCSSGTIKYAGDTESPALWDHLLSRYRFWQAQRDRSRELQKYELPRFYQRAKPRDVNGLIMNGPSWTVGDFLPEGFEAYVRLPNPFWKIVPEQTKTAIFFEGRGSGDNREDIWAEPIRNSVVAEVNGLSMTKNSDWGLICGEHGGRVSANQDQVWSWAPHECDLDPITVERLFGLLGAGTAPRDSCLSGWWEGSSDWDSGVLLVTSGWNYFVWRARFRDIGDWLQQPYSFERNLHIPHVVWAADRRWFLATLYSGYSNYLAGSRLLIDTVLASELEAYEVKLADEAR